LFPSKTKPLIYRLVWKKLQRFAQIILVDSGSTETITIATAMGEKYYSLFGTVNFLKKRNWALQNTNLQNEWVLFLDADEFVTEAFVNEVRNENSRLKYNGFIPSSLRTILWAKNCDMAMALEIGILKNRKGPMREVEDLWSHLDMEVHEHPIIEGQCGTD
jgi:glycosyltransferase involved in cell wall biosynthesis